MSDKTSESVIGLAELMPPPTAQKFFSDLATSARSPGHGEHHRQFIASLLLRAQEANLYKPEDK